MALGKQAGTVAALVTFCHWARRNGYQVGEMHGFSAVHNVHTKGSWHYDREGAFGKAADINHNQGNERASLIHAVNVAGELGLGRIYALNGTNGPAANHRGHLHVDVGDYTNLGDGPRDVPDGGDRKTANIQAAVRTAADQVWGASTDQRTHAVRAASNFHGNQFPYGKAALQEILGVTPDNIFGPKSWAAHDATVRAIQSALGVTVDGIWGGQSENAFLAVRDLRVRR